MASVYCGFLELNAGSCQSQEKYYKGFTWQFSKTSQLCLMLMIVSKGSHQSSRVQFVDALAFLNA